VALALLEHRADAGHYAVSLYSNFVVNLDFQGTMSDTESSGTADVCGVGGCIGDQEDDRDEGQVMAFAGGQRKFRCRVPARPNATGSGGAKDSSKYENHFRNAKLAHLKGRCMTHQASEEYWSYEICFGLKVTQLNTDSQASFSLGEHAFGKDQLLANGGVVEQYRGGTENRSCEIRYVCGSSATTANFIRVEEEMPLRYRITVRGPQFCSFRGDGLETQDEEGNLLRASSLLEDMRGSCINMTQGWWTYEYCFPEMLRQYHLQGSTKDPIHTLGTLSGSPEGAGPSSPDEVIMSIMRPKAGLGGIKDPRPSRSGNTRALRQSLGGGAVCDETGQARTAVMYFQCPSNWQQHPETRFVSITEGSLCEYQVLVHSGLLCGHRKLVPMLPRGKEVIQCAAEPEL